MLKKILMFLAASVLLAVPAMAMEAALPEFDVYVNGKLMEINSTKYPLLVYNDITYFPMTFDCSHRIDLASQWYDGTFYVAYSPGPSTSSDEEMPDVKHPPVCRVTLAYYPIYVNGKLIDNSAEEYPLFNYNGITYFPMTWRFATEEFNIDVEWDGALKLRTSLSKSAYGAAMPFYPNNVSIYKNDGNKLYYKFRLINRIANNSRHTSEYFCSFDGSAVMLNKRNSYSESSGMWAGTVTPSDETGRMSIENGRLCYDGEPFFEVPRENAYFITREHKLGAISEYEVYLWYETDEYARHKEIGRYYFLHTTEGIVETEYIDPSRTASAGDGAVYVNLHGLQLLKPDGSLTKITDPDHEYMSVAGEIDGKPIIRAVWGPQVALVNDGFFTLEPDGSLKRYGSYAYGTPYIIGGEIYLIDDFQLTIRKYSTGEKFSLVPADVDYGSNYNDFVRG